MGNPLWVFKFCFQSIYSYLCEWNRVALSVLHVAVCCSVLQCVAVCWSVLQCVAVCCSVLQCVAVCRSVLHCVAVCYSVLRFAVCCSVAQCVAVCCSVLQCVAGCCRQNKKEKNVTYTLGYPLSVFNKLCFFENKHRINAKETGLVQNCCIFKG